MQQRLFQPIKKRERRGPQIDYVEKGIQKVETFRGCPHECPFCYEPKVKEVFELPKIRSDHVQILDMNFLARPSIEDFIFRLPDIRSYEAVCGFDFRLLNQEIAYLLKEKRFTKIRIAWDWFMKDQYKISDALKMLSKAKFNSEEIGCFMIVNWKVSYEECLRKLDLLKVWNVKVCDCCYDGGYKYAIPEFWREREIKDFRAKCRKHNQIVRFRIDPEIK